MWHIQNFEYFFDCYHINRFQVYLVDEMNNQIRIIDYKTGKVSKSEVSIPDFNELLENPSKAKAFQLLVYAYIYLKNKPEYADREVIAGNFSFKNLKEELY